MSFNKDADGIHVMHEILKQPVNLRTKENLDHLAEMVKEMPFFKERGLTGPSLIEVVNLFSVENINSGKTIMEYGNVGEHFYFILKGRVQLKIPDPYKTKIFQACVRKIEDTTD